MKTNSTNKSTIYLYLFSLPLSPILYSIKKVLLYMKNPKEGDQQNLPVQRQIVQEIVLYRVRHLHIQNALLALIALVVLRIETHRCQWVGEVGVGAGRDGAGRRDFSLSAVPARPVDRPPRVGHQDLGMFDCRRRRLFNRPFGRMFFYVALFRYDTREMEFVFRFFRLAQLYFAFYLARRFARFGLFGVSRL